MGNWAELLPDLLVLIAKRINSFEDFVAFGGTCTSWRSVAIKENFNVSSPQLPWLMLAEKAEEDDGLRGFYSLSKGGMIHTVTLPEAREKSCRESLGWLVTAAKDGEMELLHPLSRVQIALPHQTTFKYYEKYDMNHTYFIHKAVLSASPSLTSDYVLMVIHGGRKHLGFWRPGDKTWTVIETNDYPYDDVIYLKGQFYAVDNQGRVLVCNLGGRGGSDQSTVAEVQLIGSIPLEFVSARQPYMVESGWGALLIVSRHVGFPSGDDPNQDFKDVAYETTNFHVFELDLSKQTWQEIKNLRGRALFLGHSASISVDASRFPALKPNCIYYTDDCMETYSESTPEGGGKDMGIFNLEDGSREPHYGGKSLSFSTPPVWVTPSF